VSPYDLERMTKIFHQCLTEARIFIRAVPDGSLAEIDLVRDKDGSLWSIIAAGISEETAQHHFKPGSPRSRDATIPLRIIGGGQAEILLKMRPVPWPSSHTGRAGFLAYYAPDEIPLIEITKGRINLDFDATDGRLGLFNLRWEVDPRDAGRPPQEDWLRDWWKILGHINPAHPSSHLHFNSQPETSGGERSAGWDEPPEIDLRLAIGDPNPLAFVLSVATWVRRNLEVR
jgi:hypothetical protein